MTPLSPKTLRLFTQEETIKYLPEIQAYTELEFGAEDAFQVDYLIRHREQGVQFYQAYGDFSAAPPKVMGIASCMFISYPMYDAMLAGKRGETNLDPWTPEDGQAIFWVCAVVSEKPGILAKCISAVLEQAEHHPYINRVDRAGVLCTGPQGYLLARNFGLVEREAKYKNNWMFMDMAIGAGSFREFGRKLQNAWDMTRVRDTIRQGRAIWGDNWREGNLANPNVGLAQKDIVKK